MPKGKYAHPTNQPPNQNPSDFSRGRASAGPQRRDEGVVVCAENTLKHWSFQAKKNAYLTSKQL